VVTCVPANGGDHFQCLPVQHSNGFIRTVDDVQEFLFLIGRNGESVNGSLVLEGVPRDKHFFDKCPVELEHLEPIIRTIGDIDQVVVCYQDGVNRIVETIRCGTLNELRTRRELQTIIRLLAVGAPMPLVFAGVRIEDDDAMIEIPVGYEQFICLRVDEQTG